MDLFEIRLVSLIREALLLKNELVRLIKLLIQPLFSVWAKSLREVSLLIKWYKVSILALHQVELGVMEVMVASEFWLRQIIVKELLFDSFAEIWLAISIKTKYIRMI